MYAHQVIEDMQNVLKTYEFNKRMGNIRNNKGFQYMKTIEVICPLIQKAQKFHMGDVESLDDMIKPYIGKIMFFEDTDSLRLPYPSMWFDYSFHNCATRGVGVQDSLYPLATNTKEGALVMQLTPTFLNVNFFSYILESKKWVFAYFTAFIMIGGYQGSNKEILDKLISVSNNQFNRNNDISSLEEKNTILPMFLTDDMSREQHEQLWKEFNLNFRLLEVSLRLLNCKNITKERMYPSRKLNIKRRKNNKPLIFDYHVLNVFKPGVKHDYRPSSEPLSHNRVHLCRGHFKTYTKEHPLLGRGIGTYWWQPHARGQNKEGIIVKDYKLAGGNCG